MKLALSLLDKLKYRIYYWMLFSFGLMILDETSCIAQTNLLAEKVERNEISLSNFTYSSIKNYDKQILNLNDFQSKKIIILDFWTKHCSYCIASMPKMEMLQNKYNDDIQIILVTNNSKEELEQLFKQSDILKTTRLPIVMSANNLFQYFPHKSNPYHVWISGSGKVIARASPVIDIDKQIQIYLSTNTYTIAPYVEIDIPKEANDPEKSFLDIDYGRFTQNIIYAAPYFQNMVENKSSNFYENIFKDLNIGRPKNYSFFLEKLPNYSGLMNAVRPIKDKNGVEKGLKLPLRSLKYFIDFALQEELRDFAGSEMPVIIDKRINNINIKELDAQKIEKFTYEIYMDEFNFTNALNILKIDIERCFGIKATIEKQNVNCLILRVNDYQKLSKVRSTSHTQYGETSNNGLTSKFLNVPIKTLITILQLFNKSDDGTILIDETNLPQDFRITKELKISNYQINGPDSALIIRELKNIGLSISSESRTMNTLNISKTF